MPISSFADIIGLWHNATAAAIAWNAARPAGSDLSPVTPSKVRVWKQRQRVPPARFAEIVAAAQAWGFPEVTLAMLDELYKASEPAQREAEADALDPADFA